MLLARKKNVALNQTVGSIETITLKDQSSIKGGGTIIIAQELISSSIVEDEGDF